MADKGSSTAKISLVANFEQNNIKAMGKQLSDGIKASLKDIKLDTVFDDANILDGVKKEIESIDGLLKNRTLNRLDFSSMIPPLAQALEDNSLSEQIRLQIIQGFREGLESGRTFLQGMPSGMTGDEIKAQFRQSAIMSDAIDSMPGLNKSTFKKMWKEITPQDIRQTMAMMDTYDNEEDLRKYMDYLTDAETAIQTILDNIGYETKGSSQKTAMAYGRLQYLAEEDGSGKIRKILERLNNSVVGPSKHTYKDENGKIKSREDRGYVGKQIKDVIQQMQIDDEDLSGLIEDVQLISSIRDDYFSRIPESDATIENLLAKTLQRGYKNGSLQKMQPLYTGNYKTPAHITLSDLIEASNREADTNGDEGAENAAERAENAAERAENASEEARAVAEDMKGTVEEGAAESSGASKKGLTSKKKPSAQTSSEPAEQIADDAEADAENAEHVADALDDKKARLESTIAELENKNRELQELNNKYQKAISDTFGDVKTPEEALALFKEKAVVQNVNQQLESLQNEEQQLTDKLAQITEEKNNIEKITQNINDILNKDVSVKTQREAYNKAQFALIKASTASAERFGDHAPTDKNSNEWKEWYERNKETIQQEKMAWLEYYKAMEEFESHGGETASKIANRRRLQPSDAVKHTREDWGFTSPEDLKQQLETDLQANKELLSSYEQQEQEIQNRINSIQQQKEQLKTSNAPLSSSGSQTANGVQEEGNEAGDAASKMQALAQAKKEALEANKQLAESANTTTNAIQNESDAGNFDEFINKLIEAAKLLAQLPQSFEGFKGFDLEPLNNLSQAIQQFPKEGFNISLGDSFNNLANNIDKTLQKVQELTSQAKNAEIESTFAEKYDEQIRQLKTDVEEAKRVIEEFKKTKQDVTQKSIKQIDPISQDDKIIATEYENLKQAQDKLFSANNIVEYNSALQETENILQRIRTLEQEATSKYAGQSQIDYLLMGYGDDPLDTLADRLPKSTNARNNLSVIGQLSKEYIEQQKNDIKEMSNSLKSIQIIPEKTQSNWSKKRKGEYDQIVEGAQTASQAVEELSTQLTAMETNGVNPEVLKTFLQLKEITIETIKNTQNNNDAFNTKVASAADNLISKLTTTEERLKTIQSDSKKLINIDPNMQSVLDSVAKHLEEIKKRKDAINNNPLEVINPKFTQSTNRYLTRLNGKDEKEGIINGFEQVSNRSQTDFDRIVSNYSRYATALNKLFTDIAKGSAISTGQLTKDLTRINDLSSRLANGTGLNKNNLLTGELNSKADSTIVDAQTEAANKTAIAYESMLTKITTESESAKVALEKIFGTEGITKGLSENFTQGTAEGFDKFIQNVNQAKKTLKDLEDIQKNIKNDKTWILQEENIKAYHETSEALNNSLKEIANNASNFKIVDTLDVQKLRASTAQFIKDNPALTGSEISELKNYIDQLQNTINTIDFKNIENGIQKVKQDAMEAEHTGETFFSLLTKRMKALGAYLLSFASFYEVIGVFKQGIGIIHELDDALTEMQKVSDESLASLREYQKSTFATANDIGTTAAQLQQSTADWMRLGEDLQTASQSAQTANVLFNVSEFDNINDATTALVAMSAAYADAEKDIDKMDIVDRLNLIGNNYAIATDELATALQDGAATLQTAGKQHCQNL